MVPRDGTRCHEVPCTYFNAHAPEGEKNRRVRRPPLGSGTPGRSLPVRVGASEPGTERTRV